MQMGVKRIMASAVLALALPMTILGCASGSCRQLRNPELAQGAGSGRVEPPSASTVGSNAPSKNSDDGALREKTVLVAKPDGSLQCSTKKGMSPEEMEKQLSGIKVLSREKRPDGLMHIQICGHPTGMVNVYEILASSLQEAESRGFKRFDPR